MNIQGLGQTNYNLGNNRRISFKATPEQITEKLEEAKICKGKTKTVRGIRDFFAGLQNKLSKIPNAPKSYVYELGKKNKLPESLKNEEVNGTTFKEFDKKINSTGFKCSPESTCGCGEGLTESEYTVELLKMIGTEKPEFIKISTKK